MLFLFAVGASIGSFLNVVVYRLPLEMSLVRPASHCPVCKQPIAWYDNIPIFAWLFLRGRCRHCHASFSVRYPLVELFTAVLFVGLYWAYFQQRVRVGLPDFEAGGWWIYLGHIILLCGLLASSLIDSEHWIIPLSVSYTVALAGMILSMIWPYRVPPGPGPDFLYPWAGAKSAAAALGGALGLGIGLLLLKTGLIKRSFAALDEYIRQNEAENPHQAAEGEGEKFISPAELGISARREMLWELLFLLPAVVLALGFTAIAAGDSPLARQWSEIILAQKWLAGLLGSVFGFMIGGAVVWATRILGTLAFGREAMGLGDVHLMAAVGAVLGWVSPTLAFFAAPFFGLGWALMRLILHRRREIPYGPFLSLGTLLVMIFHDSIVAYFSRAFMLPGGLN